MSRRLAIVIVLLGLMGCTLAMEFKFPESDSTNSWGGLLIIALVVGGIGIVFGDDD